MIAQLRGQILRKGPQEVVVDVAGVGYRVAIPVSTFYRLGEPGSDVELRTYTHVREDTLALAGRHEEVVGDLPGPVLRDEGGEVATGRPLVDQ